MDPSALLQWHYMIFLMPFGIAAIMLIGSTVHIGGHGHAGGHSGGHAGHGHLGGHAGHAGGHAAHTAVGHAAGHAAHTGAHAGHTGGTAHSPAGAPAAHAGQAGAQGGEPQEEAIALHDPHQSLGIPGIKKVPIILLAEIFLLIWGFLGFWITSFLVKSPHPSLFEMLPALGITALSSLVVTRLAGEVIGKILPEDASADVSHQGLFGLTGKVVFPVSPTGGRIYIYDENGTLHDEPCRVAAGNPEISRNRRAIVVDMDPAGLLIVEEIPDSIV